MSAYMVEDETINRILAGLFYATHTSSLNYPRPNEALCSAGLMADEIEYLGHRMFDLNIDGVEQRYGDGEAEKFRPLDYQYEVMSPPTPAQFYKSLGCFLYQCNEGDVSDGSNLYKLLHEYYDDLAHSIASNTVEYQQAQWG